MTNDAIENSHVRWCRPQVYFPTVRAKASGGVYAKFLHLNDFQDAQTFIN